MKSNWRWSRLDNKEEGGEKGDGGEKAANEQMREQTGGFSSQSENTDSWDPRQATALIKHLAGGSDHQQGSR